MSSAASPNSTSRTVEGSSASSLRTPPVRPQLVRPPSRPAPPPASVPSAPPAPPAPEEPQLIGPISAPSERMQYRAIGLLNGRYVASEEQFNRGNITVADGTEVDAVLLGRVTSLIKKHIDLETDHVWVVYPRTLYSEENEPSLHVQIVGVWEPENLNKRNGQAPESDREDEPRYLSTEEAAERCDHFSIRGEVAKYDEEKEEITINIVQKSRSETTKPKRPFKLLVKGTLTGRTVGYFWDLEVLREENKLLLQSASPVAVVPPKRKPKNARKNNVRRGGPRKPRAGAAKPVPKPKPAASAESSKPAASESNSNEPSAAVSSEQKSEFFISADPAPTSSAEQTGAES